MSTFKKRFVKFTAGDSVSFDEAIKVCQGLGYVPNTSVAYAHQLRGGCAFAMHNDGTYNTVTVDDTYLKKEGFEEVFIPSAAAASASTAPTPDYNFPIYELKDDNGVSLGYSSQGMISTRNGRIEFNNIPDMKKNLFIIRRGTKRYEAVKHIFSSPLAQKGSNVNTASPNDIMEAIRQRNSSHLDATIIDGVEKEVKVPTFITIQDDGHIKLNLCVEDGKVYGCMKDGTSFTCDEDGFAYITKQKKEANKILTKIKKVEEEGVDIQLGDTVLLWGPTGTGKTHRFHEKAQEMIDKKQIDYAEKITVTDGFEDTDFLAYISPNKSGGINIIERSIVTILREASKGKKVAICIDELNRGSRSLMNLILTFIDSVDGENYVLNNFVADERIVIPRANLLVYATINLGGRYSGVNSMDEALKDRFNYNFYVGYNLDNEKEIITQYFGSLANTVEQVIKDIRELYTSGEIGSSISTRGINSWGKVYSRMPVKTPKTLLKSFMDTLMFKLTSPDDYGVYSTLEEASILQVLKPLI